jgi:histidinol-phosphate phosphatase family protein
MIFQKYDLVIFDADGTLRDCTIEGQFYPLKPEEWKLKNDVVGVLEQYDCSTKKFGVATNQPGISRGELSEEMNVQLIHDMIKGNFGFLPDKAAIQCCPHSIDGACDCRKPAAGMLNKIIQHFGIAASETVFIGDSPRDKAAAENAGCHFLWIHELTQYASKNEVMDSLRSILNEAKRK